MEQKLKKKLHNGAIDKRQNNQKSFWRLHDYSTKYIIPNYCMSHSVYVLCPFGIQPLMFTSFGDYIIRDCVFRCSVFRDFVARDTVIKFSILIFNLSKKNCQTQNVTYFFYWIIYIKQNISVQKKCSLSFLWSYLWGKLNIWNSKILQHKNEQKREIVKELWCLFSRQQAITKAPHESITHTQGPTQRKLSSHGGWGGGGLACHACGRGDSIPDFRQNKIKLCTVSFQF